MGFEGKHHSEETKEKISKTLEGSKHSEETKRKMSESHKKRLFTEERKNQLDEARNKREFGEDWKNRISKSMKGKTFTQEHKQKISSGIKTFYENGGKAVHLEGKFGSKNYNWQGGGSFKPYPVIFNDNLKDMIRERDGYICQLCSKTQREEGRKLVVHHIDYDKNNCNLDNLISLCLSCNGKANSNRKYWYEYFKEVF